MPAWSSPQVLVLCLVLTLKCPYGSSLSLHTTLHFFQSSYSLYRLWISASGQNLSTSQPLLSFSFILCKALCGSPGSHVHKLSFCGPDRLFLCQCSIVGFIQSFDMLMTLCEPQDCFLDGIVLLPPFPSQHTFPPKWVYLEYLQVLIFFLELLSHSFTFGFSSIKLILRGFVI